MHHGHGLSIPADHDACWIRNYGAFASRMIFTFHETRFRYQKVRKVQELIPHARITNEYSRLPRKAMLVSLVRVMRIIRDGQLFVLLVAP